MAGTEAITVGIKTFLRTDKLRDCLASLAQHRWSEVIVADDGPIDEEREQMYVVARRNLPLRLLRLDFDTGLAAGRNEIVRQCQTDRLLMLDDDQTVGADIGRLGEVLDADPGIGGVSCIWVERDGRKCTACDLEVDGGRIVKRVSGTPVPKTTASGMQYLEFDFIPNSTLFRTDCLREFPWDPFYKIGKEHLDFYLTHKRAGKWRFAVSIDIEIGHHPEGSSSGTYHKFRGGERLEVSEAYFLQKWGVTSIVEGQKYLESPPVGRLEGIRRRIATAASPLLPRFGRR